MIKTRQNAPDQTEKRAPVPIRKEDVAFMSDVDAAIHKQLALELKILQSEYDQKKQEIEEVKGRQKELKKSLRLAVEQKNIAEPLMKKGLYSRVDFIKDRSNRSSSIPLAG
jgi:flagellar motility protein MotE (MotC chaperone)